MNDLVLLAHGGAGNLRRGGEEETAMRRSLAVFLEEGRERIVAGDAALDVVEHVVRRMEADPLFNAGRGSVLTADGTVEMDAAIMAGAERRTGAVAAVQRLLHPVTAARLVMERSAHVLLVGEGAETFAVGHGGEAVAPEMLVTPLRRRQLERAREQGRAALDHDGFVPGGTVGAVARDASGDLAAATSTGGLTNQLAGRVGDTALVGAGTWADTATCAVSATGHGEAFIRAAVAHEVDAGMRLAGLDLATACRRALDRVLALGSSGGGLVAIDAAGRGAAPFDTPGMVRGWVGAAGPPEVPLLADA